MKIKAKIIVISIVSSLVILMVILLIQDFSNEGPENKADLIVLWDEIISDFEENETVANNMYLNKTVEITGPVEKIDTIDAHTLQILLKDEEQSRGILCKINNYAAISIGEIITIKGICRGFFIDVIVDSCEIVSTTTR